ncbi:DUF6233 domain-containing protein [Streptomyces goshikiensis]|uniref:DUF6233 domain-containing protein n=1 Tax=Streptomyces goshikiensis TaxID=1942 RepID=UPI0033B12765
MFSPRAAATVSGSCSRALFSGQWAVRPAARPPPAADSGHLPARRTQPHGTGPRRRRGTRDRHHSAAAGRAPPAWLVEHGIGVGRLPVRVHAGDCWDTRSRCTPADADQIRALLAQGIPACLHCRPDTTLGVLESITDPRVET